MEESLEEEDDLLSSAIDALGQLLKLCGSTAFMPLFQAYIAPAIAPFTALQQQLPPGSPPPAIHLRVISICMMDDLIEFHGATESELVGAYMPQCIALFLQLLATPSPVTGACDRFDDTHRVLTQCSVYGLAQIAVRCPRHMVDHFKPAVEAILSILMDPNAKEVDNAGIVENAVFGLGALCTMPEYRRAHPDVWSDSAAQGPINGAYLAHLWLSALPLKEDEKESRISLIQLCQAVERFDVVVWGQQRANFPAIFRILTFQLCPGATPAPHPYTRSRIESLLVQLRQALPQDLMETALTGLSQECRAALQALGGW